MGTNANSPVMIDREEDGVVCLTFGAGITVKDLRKALKTLPGSAMLDTQTTTYFSGEDGCEGQDFPDENHYYFITTLGVLTTAK